MRRYGRTSDTSVHFDAMSATALPAAPHPMARLVEVRFATCPGSDLRVLLVRDGACSPKDSALDAHGVADDSWWCVRTSGLPDRYSRLTRGAHSMYELLRRYGFQDAGGCVNHRKCSLVYVPSDRFVPERLPEHVPQRLRDACGVPQFYRRSGVCWYATLCWTSFSNPRVRDLIADRCPADLRAHVGGCLHSREAAEALRKKLWYEYAVGDDVDDAPERDGRNGFTEFSVMAAKLGVPLVRYELDRGRLYPMSRRLRDRMNKSVTACPVEPTPGGPPHLLGLRFLDADHHGKYPIHRRVTIGGVRYKLVGMYMGSRKCGHQIGLATHSNDWRDWSVADADLHKDGIGPWFLRFDGADWKTRWWDAWSYLVHVTKFGMAGSRFCAITPHNLKDSALDAYEADDGAVCKPLGGVGSTAIDVLYVSA